MGPILDELEAEYGDRVDFETHDLISEKPLAEQYEVVSTPTFVFLNAEGEMVDKHRAQTDKQTLQDKLEALLSSS